MTEEIFRLPQLWMPHSLEDYKIHFARWNGLEEPLDVFVRSFDEWQGWQEWYPGRNDFNRPNIFSVIQFPASRDRWLFGGVWAVNNVEIDAAGKKSYNVELAHELSPLVGRLILHRSHRARGTRLNLEKHYENFVVNEILAEPYSGRTFPGYDSINVRFPELEVLIRNGRQDWLTALSNVKGVYLITDTNSRKRYVGSAYGNEGIWSRWKVYAALGDGGNEGMRELLKGRDLDYCRKFFRFCLLEHHHMSTDKDTIIARETFWKEALDTRRSADGLNRN